MQNQSLYNPMFSPSSCINGLLSCIALVIFCIFGVIIWGYDQVTPASMRDYNIFWVIGLVLICCLCSLSFWLYNESASAKQQMLRIKKNETN